MKSYKDIGCRHCGAVLPMEVSSFPTDEKNIWYPGKKCPMCNSQEFYPVIKPNEAADVKTKKEWKYNPYYGIIAIAIVILLIPVWLIATRKSSRELSQELVLICAECKEVYKEEVSGKPPYKCSKCSKDAAYQALYCQDDWVIYPRTSGKKGISLLPPCPECGRNRGTIIFKISTVQEVRGKRKLYEEWKKQAEGKENAVK